MAPGAASSGGKHPSTAAPSAPAMASAPAPEAVPARGSAQSNDQQPQITTATASHDDQGSSSTAAAGTEAAPQQTPAAPQDPNKDSASSDIQKDVASACTESPSEPEKV